MEPKIRVRKISKATGVSVESMTPAQAAFDVVGQFDPKDERRSPLMRKGGSLLDPMYLAGLIGCFKAGCNYGTRQHDYVTYWPKETEEAAA